jgi:hypothetical protein
MNLNKTTTFADFIITGAHKLSIDDCAAITKELHEVMEAKLMVQAAHMMAVGKANDAATMLLGYGTINPWQMIDEIATNMVDATLHQKGFKFHTYGEHFLFIYRLSDGAAWRMEKLEHLDCWHLHRCGETGLPVFTVADNIPIDDSNPLQHALNLIK